MTQNFNDKYNNLSQKQKDTIQTLRKRMASDLGINVKQSIPFDLYLICATTDPLTKIRFEDKEFTNTFIIRGRATKILEIIDPQWKDHYDTK